jgi:hypothetical protein
MIFRKLVLLTALGAGVLLGGGCATTSYTRSGVASLPAGVKGKTGTNASLEIDGLKIRVESLDYAKKGAAIPRFAVRLVFDPRELGYSFDPAQVTLREANGSSWKPHVYGPGWFATPSWTCSAAGVAPAAPGYQLLAPGSCFELAFDATLAADAPPLELELGGLARGRKRLDPVRLALGRRSGRSIDRVYWLEVLVAPLALAGGGM